MLNKPTTRKQAEAVRYGAWAGANGWPYNPGRCVEEVHGTDGVSHQCLRKPGRGPGGLYCGQHDPEAVKARAVKRGKVYARQAAARADRYENEQVGRELRATDPTLFRKLSHSKETDNDG